MQICLCAPPELSESTKHVILIFDYSCNAELSIFLPKKEKSPMVKA